MKVELPMGLLSLKYRHLPKLTSFTVAVFVALVVGRASVAGHGHTEEKPAHGEAESGDHGEGEQEPAVKGSGIELGQFSVRSDYPAEAQKSTVRFVIFAAVKAEKYDEMERLVKEHKQKLRDEIIIATRLTPLGVFEEPDLTSFRRRIAIRLRRTLPDLEVEGFYISDFGMIVRSL
jgi:hypothetical protein